MRDTYIFLGLLLLFAAVNIGLVANGSLAADWTGLGIIVAAGMTLALYSFLYKDNPLFKFAEHVSSAWQRPTYSVRIGTRRSTARLLLNGPIRGKGRRPIGGS